MDASPIDTVSVYLLEQSAHPRTTMRAVRRLPLNCSFFLIQLAIF